MGFFDELGKGLQKAVAKSAASNNHKARQMMKDEHFSRKETASCRSCGTAVSFGSAQADHIFPRSKGGPDASWNVQVLCAPCNRDKSNKVDGRVAQGYAKKMSDVFNDDD